VEHQSFGMRKLRMKPRLRNGRRMPCLLFRPIGKALILVREPQHLVFGQPIMHLVPEGTDFPGSVTPTLLRAVVGLHSANPYTQPFGDSVMAVTGGRCRERRLGDWHEDGKGSIRPSHETEVRAWWLRDRRGEAEPPEKKSPGLAAGAHNSRKERRQLKDEGVVRKVLGGQLLCALHQREWIDLNRRRDGPGWGL